MGVLQVAVYLLLSSLLFFQQSDELELKNKQVEIEITHLQAQIKELETLLDSHRCFPGANPGNIVMKNGLFSQPHL